ncbi:carbohydrate ABC transporter permease [Conexibacter arvalis]|uniref:Raffinose/stachyose/melibiose transport system permease protein n=1 Tax=Conexibacter arvalis TaxID=912552 RepID=A0A840I9B0_9ACTN|nr:sugar ABC transporter permease [Conexibacter arvalis]MBB4660520.1 raffinose/stachyose/melibiose transport system permease protein [Conexibacter arvalis]
MRRARVPWLFVAPALLLYAAFYLAPTLLGAGYAFTDWNGLESPSFVGLDNFSRIFGEAEGLGALRHTLVLCVLYVVAVNVVGLGLAVGLHGALKTRHVLRALFFAPVVVSPLAVAYVWKFILDPEGPLNRGLEAIGLGTLAQPWLGKPATATAAVLVTMVWQFSGWSMVIYLAGLQSIQAELYEAAEIDGAGTWRRFVDITRPLLLPALTINVSLSLIAGLMVFDQVIALTGGGPGTATETIATQVYEQALVNGRFGYSAAMALTLAVAVGTLSFVQMRAMRRQEG